MNPPTDAPPAWLPLLIPVVFPFFFAAMWCGICLLLSVIGGWSRLAEKFPAQQPPTGTRFSMQSGRVGVTNYRSILTIHTSPAGLRLAVWPIFRLGHKTLLIPWTEIHHAAPRCIFWMESVVFEVGSPKIAKLQLPKKIFAGQPVTV